MKGHMVAVVAAAWIAPVCAGLHALASYENTPGAASESPAQWPSNIPIAPGQNRATLVMLAHPYCPGTRASVGELALLMASFQGRLAAHVFFFREPDSRGDWEKSDLWDNTSAIPGVTVSWDRAGAIARRFAAVTSGQVVAYNARGRLLFSGVTGVASPTRTPAFGCSLLTPEGEKHAG
jgi:hypothetical protein